MKRSMRFGLATMAAFGISLGLAPAAHAADLQVTSYGATPNDTTDDTNAIQRALDALTPGQVLNFAPGTYRHSRVLRANVAGSILSGPTATLQATKEGTSAFDVNANNVTVNGLTFATPTTTKRWTTPDQHKVTVIGQTGVALNAVKVAGSAAAGIFIHSSSDFHLTDTDVRTTRGAGVHITGGSNNGDVTRNRSTFTGDDGVGIVSFAADSGPVHHVTVVDPIVTGNNGGSGLAVLGGEDVEFRNFVSEDSAFAAVSVGTQPNSRVAQRVQLQGGRAIRANQNATLDFGAVLVTNAKAGTTVADVQVNDVTVTGTRATAPGSIRATVENGGALSAIAWTNVAIFNGPTAGYQGNAPSGTQIFTNVTKDGVPLTAP
jgi:hypothetical protein